MVLPSGEMRGWMPPKARMDLAVAGFCGGFVSCRALKAARASTPTQQPASKSFFICVSSHSWQSPGQFFDLAIFPDMFDIKKAVEIRKTHEHTRAVVESINHHVDAATNVLVRIADPGSN